MLLNKALRPEQRYRSIKQTLKNGRRDVLSSGVTQGSRRAPSNDHHSSKLKPDSEERRDDLYSLATSPEVLQSQEALP